MSLSRRKVLQLAGLGLSSIVLPSWKDEVRTSLSADRCAVQLPVRLSSNENPYGPSAKAQEAMMAQVAKGNRYPWELTAQLLEALAAHHQISQDNLLIGAGSTELLDVAGRYAAQQRGELVLASPSYDYWTSTPAKLGLNIIRVPVTAGKKIDLQGMLKAVSNTTRLVYICNPNNPTGTLIKRAELIPFIESVNKKTMILIDEAYLDYSAETSVLPLVDQYPNLVVVKTFSKLYGMAGCRIGYAVANATLLRELESLQSMPNGGVSGMSVAGALASLNDLSFARSCVSNNEQVRAYTIRELERLQMPCIPSHTNFVYFTLANYRGDYFEKLKTAQVIGTKIYEEAGKWTRITVGTEDEMKYFIGSIGG